MSGTTPSSAIALLANVAADLLVLLHLAFIVFALLGGLLALRWQWMPWLHGPAFGWAALVAFMGWICPLTPLENALRRASGGAAYTGDFIGQYILPVIYPVGLTRELQIFFGAAVLILNGVIYGVVWHRGRTFRA